jgi:hypothetical protein
MKMYIIEIKYEGLENWNNYGEIRNKEAAEVIRERILQRMVSENVSGDVRIIEKDYCDFCEERPGKQTEYGEFACNKCWDFNIDNEELDAANSIINSLEKGDFYDKEKEAKEWHKRFHRLNEKHQNIMYKYRQIQRYLSEPVKYIMDMYNKEGWK